MLYARLLVARSGVLPACVLPEVRKKEVSRESRFTGQREEIPSRRQNIQDWGGGLGIKLAMF